MSDTKRTTASRRWDAWSLSFWLFGGSVVVVFIILGADPTGGGASVWLAPAAIVAGGSLAGWLAPRATSTKGLVAALLMPIPLLAIFGFLMVGLSQSADDLPGVGQVLALALILFDVPMVVAFKARATRRAEVLLAPTQSLEEHSSERELDRATDAGRAVTVVRDYADDEEGREHLEADTKALAARGYELLPIKRRPKVSLSGLLVSLVADVLLQRGSDPSTDGPRVEATFRLRSSAHERSAER